MENIVLKVSYLKLLKICTESENQYISVLPIRTHAHMNSWIVDKYTSVYKILC